MKRPTWTSATLGAGLRPGIAAWAHRDRAAQIGDALAGLSVAAYLVPQVLAYAQVAGLPAVAGLWAAVGGLVAYAAFGSSRLVSAGPESTTAVITLTALTPLAAHDPTRYAAFAAVLALLVAGVCFVGRWARLGFLADALSRPVLAGYLAGLALIMIVGQLGRITGVPVEGETVLAQLRSFVADAGHLHLPTLAVATGVVVAVVGLQRLAPRLPAPLLAVLAAAAAAAVLGLERFGVETVGLVPRGLPAPALPVIALADIATLLLPAVGVAVVAYSDTVLTGRAFATRGGGRIDANQELLGLGTANLAAGLLQGFPVSSSGSRTVIAEETGARSQLSSLVSASVVVVVLLVGGPILAAFPTAALGGLVVYAAARLVDFDEFRRFARLRRTELALAIATTIAVLLLGVLYGVLAAVGLSILDLLRRVSRPHAAVLGFAPGLAGMHDVDDYPDTTTVPGLVVFRYDAPLFFANADDFRTRALAALDDAPGTRWLLLNMEAVVDIDTTACDELSALYDEAERRGIVVALAHAKHDLLDDLGRVGLLARIGEDHVFPTNPTAVAAFRLAEGAG
jgi:high affinity sulfate transporter 1